MEAIRNSLEAVAQLDDAKQAAELLFKAVCAACRAEGEDPEHEVALQQRGQSWFILWDQGGLNWGVDIAMSLTHCRIATGRLPWIAEADACSVSIRPEPE